MQLTPLIWQIKTKDMENEWHKNAMPQLKNVGFLNSSDKLMTKVKSS